jgi:hypothetical protein
MLTFPFQELFLLLLVGYGVYSAWASLNPRLPVYAALVLLLVAAIADWSGAVGAANNIALDVAFLLMAGVALIALDRWRHRDRLVVRPATADTPGTEPTKEHEPSTQHSLDDLESERVPVVDAAGQEHDQHERAGDGETHER